jgi:hypothetical protein
MLLRQYLYKWYSSKKSIKVGKKKKGKCPAIEKIQPTKSAK